MKKIDWKNIFSKVWPHAIAIAVLYIITVVFFAPIVIDGKALPQSDDISAIGMVKDAEDLRSEDGVGSEWTNGMFSGMPTTAGAGQGSSFNVFDKISRTLCLGLPYKTAGLLFSYLLAFYVFVICMGGSIWLALLGAVAYGFASYNIIIIDVGHVTKAASMAYIAPMLMGVILVFRKRYLFGALLTLLSLGAMVARNHVQICYYAAIMVLCVAFAFLIYYIIASAKKSEKFNSFLKACGVLAIVAILAVLPSANNLLPTYEYGKDTMRGGQQLSQKMTTDKPSTGLDIDYAYAWSEGRMETFTHLIPNLYGGGHTMLEKDDPTLRRLQEVGYGSNYLPTYWGNQPFTAGPLYAGAIVCWLFVLGLFVVKGPEKWWVIAACIISILLSWGKNFLPFNEWMFHNLPLYNKFRTPSMALVILGVAMPMLGVWGLHDIVSGKTDRKRALTYTYISAGITGGLCLLFMLLAKTVFTFTGVGDEGFMQQLTGAGFSAVAADSVMQILRDYRCSMLVSDAWRSFLFIAFAFAAFWLYLKGKVKNGKLTVVVMALLVLVDAWGVARRYLDETHFEKSSKVETPVRKTETDEMILQDTNVNYRVLNLSTNTFNESQTSYFHKSIGGYSPAKMRRYQDLIDAYLSPEIQQMMNSIYQTQGNLAAAPTATPILNMLNCKYVIVPLQGGQTAPVQNPHCMGNAWFVEDVRVVDDADQEFRALGTADLHKFAIVDKQFAGLLPKHRIQHDSTATITNTLCKPNHLVYTATSATDQLAVFSEIYYDRDGWNKHSQDGWEATIDGKEVPHFRADYVLRAMVIPAGEHTIEFKFVPYTRLLAHRITNASSIVVIILLIGAIVYGIYRNNHLQRRKVA